MGCYCTLGSSPEQYFLPPRSLIIYMYLRYCSRDDIMVRVCTSNQCGLNLIPAQCHKWLDFVVDSHQGFYLGCQVILPPQNPLFILMETLFKRVSMECATATATANLFTAATHLLFVHQGRQWRHLLKRQSLVQGYSTSCTVVTLICPQFKDMNWIDCQ